MTGATSLTVRVARAATRARVRYTAVARDAVDGAIPPSCAPASGSWFRVGKTRVECSSTDSSGNTGAASFTVLVKRR